MRNYVRHVRTRLIDQIEDDINKVIREEEDYHGATAINVSISTMVDYETVSVILFQAPE